MIKYLYTTLTVFLFFSCSEENKKEETCIKPEEVMIDHIPSEMAVLMDNMYRVSDSVKNELSKDSSTFIPLAQEVLLTAKSVNERVETEEFQTMAQSYLNLLSTFNESKSDRKKKFNSMVDGCMNCHEQICQGPMVRIKKLYIK